LLPWSWYGIPTDARSDINEAVMHDDITRVESAAAQHHVSVDQVTQHPELYGLTPTAITRYTNAVQTRNGLRMDSDGGKKTRSFCRPTTPRRSTGVAERPSPLAIQTKPSTQPY
jgi:hypothetical protein